MSIEALVCFWDEIDVLYTEFAAKFCEKDIGIY